MTKTIFFVLMALGLAGCATLRDYSDYRQKMDEKCATSCCGPCAEKP